MAVDIVALIQQEVGLLSTTPLFTHGSASFNNYKADQIPADNGFAFLYEPIVSDDEANLGGAYTEHFKIMIFFGGKVPATQLLDFDRHHAVAMDQRAVRKEFINRLKLREEIDTITNIRTEEWINKFDENVSGVMLFVTLNCTSGDSVCIAEPAPLTSDLELITSDFEIPIFFADASSTGFFFKGSTTPIGKDVATDQWFDVFATGGWKSSYWSGGALTKVAHPVIGDTARIGGAGNGWNAIDPDCETTPLKFQGELCLDFTYNGDSLDFHNSHMDMLGLLEMNNIIPANITDGTIEEAFWQIDRTIAVTGQSVIPILFGLESPTTVSTDWDGDAGNVAARTYDWMDQIEAEYPDQEFIFVFDAAALWNATGADTAYNKKLIAYRAIDNSKVAIRLYCHGFKLWAGKLNGYIPHDVEVINTAMTETLDAFSQAIASSAFDGCKVFIAQLSSNDSAYTPQVVKGFWYLVSAYPRMLKHFIEKARDGVVNYFGASLAGLNSWINNNLVKNLDFKAFSVMNRLIEEDTLALTITYESDDVYIYGGLRDGRYCLVILNNGSEEFILPTSINFDGTVRTYAVAESTGEWCEADDSTDSTTYTPTESCAARSINYLELEPGDGI